jgi:hypothetical protein
MPLHAILPIGATTASVLPEFFTANQVTVPRPLFLYTLGVSPL